MIKTKKNKTLQCLTCDYCKKTTNNLNCVAKSYSGYFIGIEIDNNIYIQTPKYPNGTIRKSLPSWCALKNKK